MSAAPAEYPQIRPMFADALKAMAEGETKAEKQIVYVLNEARAALPCPAFVARHDKAYTLTVRSAGKNEGIVGVMAQGNGMFLALSPLSGEWFNAEGVLALADAVTRLLRVAHSVIMSAAAEAYPASIEPPRKSPY